MLVTKIKRGRRRCSARCSTCPYLAPPVAATHGVRLPAQPRHRPGQRRSSGKLGLPEPGWFNDPTWSKPALTLLALWGIGDLMVIFMAALLDVPREQYEAAELDGAGALAAVPLRHAAQHLADRAVRRGHRRDRRRCSTTPSRWSPERSPAGMIGGSGQQFEPGYPDEVDADPAAAGLQPRLPALRHRRGLRRSRSCCSRCRWSFTALLMRRGAGLLGGGLTSTRDAADPDASAAPRPTLAPAAPPRGRSGVGRRALLRRSPPACSSCCRSSSSS